MKYFLIKGTSARYIADHLRDVSVALRVLVGNHRENQAIVDLLSACDDWAEELECLDETEYYPEED